MDKHWLRRTSYTVSVLLLSMPHIARYMALKEGIIPPACDAVSSQPLVRTSLVRAPLHASNSACIPP